MIVQYPLHPPYDSGTIVASSPLQYPLHPPTHTHPHTPKGCTHALRGDAHPKRGGNLVPMPPFEGAGEVAVGGLAFSLPKIRGDFE